MSREVSVRASNGGCLGCLVFILLFWALIFGLPTSWGVLNIDIFPPAITMENNND